MQINFSAVQKPAINQDNATRELPLAINPNPHFKGVDSFIKFSAAPTEQLSYKKVKTIQDPVLGDIEMYRYSNGMELYALKKDDVPLVSYGVVVKTGASNETTRTSGASHFLEHLIFKGSDKLAPGEGDKIVENLGGSSNAYTSWGETFFYAHDLPKDNLDRIIEVWTDLLTNPSIPQEELDRERHVVLEEINMYANNPSDKLSKNTLKMLWPDSRSHWPILGPRRNIKNISRDEILRFVKHYYAPENRAVIVIGDFDTTQVLEKVKEEHEKNPFTSEVSFQPLRPLSPATEASEMIIKKNLSQSQMTVAFTGPKPGSTHFEKEFATLEILSHVLAGGRSARLYQSMVETELAHDVSAAPFSTGTDSLFELEAAFTPENYDEVKRVLTQNLTQIAQEGVTEAELKKAILNIKLNTASVGETQYSLIRDMAKMVSQGRLEDSYGQRIEKQYETITSRDIQNVVKKYLSPAKAKVSALVPNQAALKKAQGNLQFSGKLTPSDQSTMLEGGTEVITRNKQGSLKTAISVVLKGGRALDATPGESLILADLLQQGSANYSSTKLNEMLEEKGLSLGTEVSGDQFVVTIEGLNEYKVDMLSLLKEVLQQPRFEQADVDFVKKQLISSQKSLEETQPRQYISVLNSQTAYPANHPYSYGRYSNLSDSLSAITPDDLKRLYQRMFNQADMSIAAVGDVDHKEMVDYVTELVAPMSKTPVNVPNFTLDPLSKNQVTPFTREGLAQAEIMRSWHVPGIKHQDKAALSIVNKILTGGMSTRLFQIFREKPEKPLAYTARSQFDAALQGGAFKFYIGTAPENITLVQTMFQQEIDDLATHLPSEEEFNRAKELLKSETLVRSQKNSDVSLYLATHRKLGIDSNEELLDAVNKVTREDIQRVVNDYLIKPSQTVIMAPEKALKNAGLG